MSNFFNQILVVVLLLNLFVLGTSRITSVIRGVAIQGALIGMLPLLLPGHVSRGAFLMAVLTIVLKGVVIPVMMNRALRDVEIKREVEPVIGFQASVILGALGAVWALLFAGRLPLTEAHADSLVVPASRATVLTGFILLITRFKALTQVMGYLVLENGVFIFGMLLVQAMPLVVEMGSLLDLFVAVFVICIIVNHINRAFSTLDTRQLASLKE